MTRPVVQLDGRTLSCSQVRDVARGTAAAAVTGDGRERARVAARTAADVAARSQVYGRTTGVGANRDQMVSPADLDGHGLRLLRSHAMTSGTWDRHRGHEDSYDVVDIGFNFRLDEPRAALGLSRLL